MSPSARDSPLSLVVPGEVGSWFGMMFSMLLLLLCRFLNALMIDLGDRMSRLLGWDSTGDFTSSSGSIPLSQTFLSQPQFVKVCNCPEMTPSNTGMY